MFYLSCSEWTFSNMLIRVFVSLLLGCIVGLDRGIKKRGAGSKTSTIVCLGSTLVMLTAQYMNVIFPGQTDIARMAAQVISGVGFLGVGTIIVSGHQVRGLTTAASLWACACIGLAVGIGFIDGAIIITLCMLFALHLLPYVERHVYRHSRYISLYIELENSKAIPLILDYFHKNAIRIDSFDVIKGKIKEQPLSLQTTLRLPTVYHASYIEAIEAIPGVYSADVLD